MRLALLTILLLTIGTFSQDVEVVVKLLQELRQEAVDELAKLGERFEPIHTSKSASILIITQAKMDQNAECYNRQQDVDQKLIEIDLANNYKEWMQKRQSSNTERVSVLSQNVCEHNNNYIDNVKNARILLRLIAFLRKALQSQLPSTSLSQISDSDSTMKEISHIVSIYKEYRQSSALIQTTQEDEEFMNGTVEQLIEMLNKMEKDIQQDIGNGQNGQVQVGVTFSEFKLRLEKENEVFDRQIQVQNDLIANYNNQLVTLISRVDKCQMRLKEVTTTLLTAEEDLRYDLEGQQADKNRIQEEIALFDWLINHYQGIEQINPEDTDGNTGDNDGNTGDNNRHTGDTENAGEDGNNGVIDYTPLHEMSDAWASSTSENENDDANNSENTHTAPNHNEAETENNGHDGVIDYTPVSEQDDAWVSEGEFVQKKQKSKRRHAIAFLQVSQTEENEIWV